MWVTVPAQTVTGAASAPAAGSLVTQSRGEIEPRQAEEYGPQLRQPADAAEGLTANGQHGGPAMSGGKVLSEAAQLGAGLSAAERPTKAVKSAMKRRRGTAAAAGHQPAAVSSQRQRPKPRRAAAVILDVIDDRTAYGAASELSTGPAASAAVPMYERAEAALGGAAPAQPTASACGRSDNAGSEPLGSVASVQASQAAPVRSAAGAGAPLLNRPADGHVQVDPNLGNGTLVSPMAAQALLLHQGHLADEQHQADARSVDRIAGGTPGDGVTPAPAVHAALPLPEVAALSLEATHAVATTVHAAAAMQLVVQHAAAVYTEIQGPAIGADPALKPPDSAVERAAEVTSPVESPPKPGARGDSLQSLVSNEMQPSSATVADESAAAADHIAAGTQRRPKKRRRKAAALGSNGSLPGASLSPLP